jgi:ribosome-binding protein aMBF1 (putative translation factor)
LLAGESSCTATLEHLAVVARKNTSDEPTVERAFGVVIRALRRQRGLSQEALAFESGYHRTYIGLLERGEKTPSLRAIFSIADALNVQPSELVRQSELALAKQATVE